MKWTLKNRLNLTLIMIFLVFPSFAYSSDYLAAMLAADTEIKIAWIYGGAIAICGISIGTGLYFGLRFRKDHD